MATDDVERMLQRLLESHGTNEIATLAGELRYTRETLNDVRATLRRFEDGNYSARLEALENARESGGQRWTPLNIIHLAATVLTFVLALIALATGQHMPVTLPGAPEAAAIHAH